MYPGTGQSTQTFKETVTRIEILFTLETDEFEATPLRIVEFPTLFNLICHTNGPLPLFFGLFFSLFVYITKVFHTFRNFLLGAVTLSLLTNNTLSYVCHALSMFST